MITRSSRRSKALSLVALSGTAIVLVAAGLGPVLAIGLLLARHLR